VERLCKKELTIVGPKQWQLELDNQLVNVMSFVPSLVPRTPASLKSVIICFSVVHRDSFESIRETYNQHLYSALKNNLCHKILVGLNADLRTSKTSQKKVTTILSNQNEVPNYFAKLPKGMTSNSL
jgi:hypothetical protein